MSRPVQGGPMAKSRNPVMDLLINYKLASPSVKANHSGWSRHRSAQKRWKRGRDNRTLFYF